MEPVKPSVQGPVHTVEPQALASARWLADITDTAIRLPFGISIGLDFLIGLIPGIGDLLMFGVSLVILWQGKKLGAPASLLGKMLRNALVDVAAGFIPVVGDLFDAWFKANRRNVKLLETWWLTQD